MPGALGRSQHRQRGILASGVTAHLLQRSTPHFVQNEPTAERPAAEKSSPFHLDPVRPPPVSRVKARIVSGLPKDPLAPSLASSYPPAVLPTANTYGGLYNARPANTTFLSNYSGLTEVRGLNEANTSDGSGGIQERITQPAIVSEPLPKPLAPYIEVRTPKENTKLVAPAEDALRHQDIDDNREREVRSEPSLVARAALAAPEPVPEGKLAPLDAIRHRLGTSHNQSTNDPTLVARPAPEPRDLLTRPSRGRRRPPVRSLSATRPHKFRVHHG